jgi:hypothetical protein
LRQWDSPKDTNLSAEALAAYAYGDM